MEKTNNYRNTVNVIPVVAWLGGAVYTYNQPGMDFWDAVIWLYYVGRFVAQHFTTFHY